MDAHGVYPILPTPFLASGAVDHASLRRLVRLQAELGVQGVAILGFMGEAHKLTDEERTQVIRTVVDEAAGALPVWVGVRALGTDAAIAQAREAEALGAAAVFVAPTNVQDDGVLFEFYRRVAEAIGIPVVLHDYPASFGTLLSTELIARLAREVPGIQCIKLEEPPTPQKTSKVIALTGGGVKVFGGLGGVYMLEELERGAAGIMTGFSFPEVLLRIYEKFREGDRDGAARTFDHYMPLIRYEFQPKIGLAFRKYVYKKRGVFATDVVRHPGAALDETTALELEAIVRRVGLKLAPGAQELV